MAWLMASLLYLASCGDSTSPTPDPNLGGQLERLGQRTHDRNQQLTVASERGNAPSCRGGVRCLRQSADQSYQATSTVLTSASNASGENGLLRNGKFGPGAPRWKTSFTG
jgi:hypothetical protein